MSVKAGDGVPPPDASREEVAAWNAAVQTECRANGDRVGVTRTIPVVALTRT